MNFADLKERITAFVDNEIMDPQTVRETKELIANDENAYLEYRMQMAVKSVLRSKCRWVSAKPAYYKSFVRSLINLKYGKTGTSTEE